MTCDAPQLPCRDLATVWKGWACFNSCCSGAERSGHGLGLWSWCLVCLRGHQGSPEEGFGGLYVVSCFVLFSWPRLGGAQPCALMVVVCHVVPKTTERRTGSSVEAAPGRAAGKQWFGDKGGGDPQADVPTAA